MHAYFLNNAYAKGRRAALAKYASGDTDTAGGGKLVNDRIPPVDTYAVSNPNYRKDMIAQTFTENDLLGNPSKMDVPAVNPVLHNTPDNMTHYQSDSMGGTNSLEDNT